jgi:hypothetical protein
MSSRKEKRQVKKEQAKTQPTGPKPQSQPAVPLPDAGLQKLSNEGFDKQLEDIKKNDSVMAASIGQGFSKLTPDEVKLLSPDQVQLMLLTQRIQQETTAYTRAEIASAEKSLLDLGKFDFSGYAIPAFQPSKVALTYLKPGEELVIPAVLFAGPDAAVHAMSPNEILTNYGVTLRDLGVFHKSKNIFPQQFDPNLHKVQGMRQLIEVGRLSPIAIITTMAMNIKSCGGNVHFAAIRAGLVARGIFPVTANHYKRISEKLTQLDMGEIQSNSNMVPEWRVVLGAPSNDDFLLALNFTKSPEFKEHYSQLVLDTAAFAGFRHFADDHYALSADERMMSRIKTEKKSLQIPEAWRNAMPDDGWARTVVHPHGFPQLYNLAYACSELNFLFSSTQLRQKRAHYGWNSVGATYAVVKTICAMPFGNHFAVAFADAIEDLERLKDDLEQEHYLTSPLAEYYMTGVPKFMEAADKDIVERLQGLASAFMNIFAEQSSLGKALSLNKSEVKDSAQYMAFKDIWTAFKKQTKKEDPTLALGSASRAIGAATRAKAIEGPRVTVVE